MKFIADFHIHSKYSRATSRDMDLENLDKWAGIKGINVLGTGDFSHPEWFKNLKEKLEPAEPGLFKLKKQRNGTRFILTNEISCIYSKKGKVRKIHILVFVPSFEIAEKINVQLGWIGNLKSDGRPILGLDAKELAKIVLNVSQDCLIVPAHCLLPDTLIHTQSNLLTKIKDIKVDDWVFTHRNRWQKVTQIFKRSYKGKAYEIQPYYFSQGLIVTPEHPFYAIRTKKNCSWNNGICKPTHEHNSRCKEKFYKKYQPEWIMASELQKGDVLMFPRFRKAFHNHAVIRLNELVSPPFQIQNENIFLYDTHTTPIYNKIVVDKNFCRLAGYYLAEGHTNERDAIGFTFHKNEEKYISDVKKLMTQVLGFQTQAKAKIQGNSIELIFYSKILSESFSQLFYCSDSIRNASTKAMPKWMLGLTPELQVEIIKGWWRGDKGYTSSRTLMNQLKIIFLRLGIIPSIYVDTVSDHQNRANHFFKKREIRAQHDSFAINRLSFFEDPFRLLDDPEFGKFKYKSKTRHGWIDKNYVYLPIRDIKIKNHKGEVYNLEVAGDNSYVTEFTTVHNCWTPWFSVFGSKSGFDSIEECFEEYSKYIYAIETGLSSSPEMNWRLSALDRIALISNSDAHSPRKIGREANIFDTELSYKSIIEAIKTKNPQKFLYTIEFFPEEGKYHFDGHRNCQIRLSPQETRKYNGICPVCGKPLTIGVLNRVEELADREEGFKPKNAIPFKSLVPLEEIIADALGQSTGTKEVEKRYKDLIEKLGSDFNVLLEAPEEELLTVTLPEIGEAIIKVREGAVVKEPGYDGVYGKIKIFSLGEQKNSTKQDTLF